MTTYESQAEDLNVISIVVTSIAAMALLVMVSIIGLVCCKKRKPEMDTNITAGNEGHYAKRGTTLFTSSTGPHNNAVTIHFQDVPVVKYDRKLDNDSNLIKDEPPLDVSVTSKTRLVVIEDDSDYAVIGHDDGASMVERLSATVSGTSEGENIQIVDVEMFDEINYEDDYATLDGDVRNAPMRKLSSAVEGPRVCSEISKVGNESSKVCSRRSEVGSDSNLQIEETKFVDEYATIVPKSLRIKDPSKLKLMARAVSDQDTSDHDISGGPDSSSSVDHRVSSQSQSGTFQHQISGHTTEENVSKRTQSRDSTYDNDKSTSQNMHRVDDKKPEDHVRVNYSENSRNNIPGNVHYFDPHSFEPFRNISSEQTNVNKKTNNLSLTIEREKNSAESALQKLHFLLDDLPSDTEENAVILPDSDEDNSSAPSSQTVRALMVARVSPHGLSTQHANVDDSQLQPHRLFELNI